MLSGDILGGIFKINQNFVNRINSHENLRKFSGI